MSVGQGKSLRAHQHKMNRKVGKTAAQVITIKDRQDRQRSLAQQRAGKLNKPEWKAGDWAVFDLNIVQIKQVEPYVEVSDATISTSGRLLDRLRPLTLRNKGTIETFEWYYKELKKIRGERGFNYPDINRLFCDLSLEAMDGPEDNKEPFEKAQAFLRAAQDYKPVIQGVCLFRA